MIPPRARWTLALVALLALVAAGLVVVALRHGGGPLGLVSPLATLATQRPGGLASALLRVAILLPTLGLAGAQPRSALLSGVVFLFSLVWSGLLLPAVGLAALLASAGVRQRQRDPAAPAGLGDPAALAIGAGTALAAGALLVAATGLGAVSAPAAPPSTLPERVAWYAERGNRFHTHALARDWCAAERVPAQGCLVLAHASRDLGEVAEARRVARRLAALGRDPDLRQRAAALLGELPPGGEAR